MHVKDGTSSKVALSSKCVAPPSDIAVRKDVDGKLTDGGNRPWLNEEEYQSKRNFLCSEDSSMVENHNVHILNSITWLNEPLYTKIPHQINNYTFLITKDQP